jgi:Spy/CpxP family protein refolding chaperone
MIGGQKQSRWAAVPVLLLLFSTLSVQAQPGGPGHNMGSVNMRGHGPPSSGDRGPRGPGGEREGRGPRLDGKWWMDPIWVQRLTLTPDQQRHMEEVFQQSRLRLIDLRAALEKQEALLDPLIGADHPQEAHVLAQIDRVAEARAELEKANARMLWGFRLVLSPEQWRMLQAGEASGYRNAGRGRDHE